MLSSGEFAQAQSILRQGLTDIFTYWSKTARMVYAQIEVDCPNCVEVGPYGSINQYRSGGPVPFGNGRCPYCGGGGKISDRHHIDIEVVVRRISKESFKQGESYIGNQPIQIEIPEGALVTKLKMSDLEHVRRAEYMILEPDIAPEQKYIRMSEPQDMNNIVQNEYINVIWRRA